MSEPIGYASTGPGNVSVLFCVDCGETANREVEPLTEDDLDGFDRAECVLCGETFYPLDAPDHYGNADGEDVRTARFDQKAAFLTFDALERQVVAAVGAGEDEVAAETAEALFLLQSDLPDWTDDYHGISEEFEVEEEAIGTAMESVYAWAVENDHKARAWFEEGADGE